MEHLAGTGDGILKLTTLKRFTSMSKIKKQTRIWTTRAGQRIRICDMEDSHLHNVAKFIHKKMEDLGFLKTWMGDEVPTGVPDAVLQVQEALHLEIKRREELAYESKR